MVLEMLQGSKEKGRGEYVVWVLGGSKRIEKK